MKQLERCEVALDKLCDLLGRFEAVVNVCMVDFIVDDVFENCLPGEKLKADLLALDNEDLERFHTKTYEEDSHLGQIMSEIEKLSPEELKVVDKVGLNSDGSLLRHFDRIMGEKKMHEVVEFAEFDSSEI